jgi:hypothetical protein
MLIEGAEVSERQMELVFGQGRHPDADRIERDLPDDGADPATARLATVLARPIEEIEARKQTPLLALDFRPQASLIVLWALGDAKTRRIIERAHERAIAKALRWLPVMEIAGVDSELIDWSSTRRQRIEDVLEGLTYKFAQEHGRLPGERARHGLGWQAAQDTRPEKKTPRPLKQLLAWWRAPRRRRRRRGRLHRPRQVRSPSRPGRSHHADVVAILKSGLPISVTLQGTQLLISRARGER